MKIAVIPARGGSQRIPGKNLKPFMGKPIIAYSIEAALASGCFDRVLVSTDSDAIAKCAREYGAEVPFVRPSELADAYTGTNAVVKHALEWLAGQGIDVEQACCIYATAPFIRTDDIQRGLALLQTPGSQFAVTVTTFPAPVQRAMYLMPENGLAMFNPEHLNTRSQDLPEGYHDAAQIYWGRANAFIEQLPLFAEHTAPIVIPRHRVQDIDTPEDWVRAELMYAALQQYQGDAL